MELPWAIDPLRGLPSPEQTRDFFGEVLVQGGLVGGSLATIYSILTVFLSTQDPNPIFLSTQDPNSNFSLCLGVAYILSRMFAEISMSYKSVGFSGRELMTEFLESVIGAGLGYILQSDIYSFWGDLYSSLPQSIPPHMKHGIVYTLLYFSLGFVTNLVVEVGGLVYSKIRQ